MKHLLVNPKVLTFILFLLLLLPSCNNEELFIAEESAIEEEEVPNTEDEAHPIDAVDDSVTTTENIAVNIEALLNDLNLHETNTISYTYPSHGVLTINDNETPINILDDSVVYKQNEGFSGIDSFEYTICDATNSDNCDTAIVTINVEPLENDFATELKAFPTAYGGGATATGGRGGVLVVVNTLTAGTALTYDATNDTYSGGIYHALIDGLGGRPRTIIFTVSGNIDLSTVGSAPHHSVRTYEDNITILGQSAPEGGITLHGGHLWFDESDNLIIRYIRTRVGTTSGNPIADDMYTAGIHTRYGDDLIIDHCSTSWGGDKGFNLSSSNAINSQMRHTTQRSTISDSHTLMMDGVDNTAMFSTHGDISVHLNLFARGGNRTPNISGFDGYVEVLNNVIQSNGTKLGVIKGSDNGMVNWNRNYYKIPPSKGSLILNKFQTSESYPDLRLNSKNNYYHTGASLLLDGTETTNNEAMWGDFVTGSPLSGSQFVADEWNGISNKPTYMTAAEAYSTVVTDANVGACHYIDDNGNVGYYMDSWDTDLITGLKNNTMQQRLNSENWIVPTIPANARPIGWSTIGDGIPDFWRNAYMPANAKYNDLAPNGYSWIELFYNKVDR